MHQISKARGAGVTLVELLVGMAIVGFLMAIGMPAMNSWVSAARARSAIEFYAEGLASARREAVKHNARSRIVFTQNAGNFQHDWQVDICYPAPGTPCDDNSGVWSTPTAPAANDPEGAAGYTSLLRRADALPKATVIAPSLTPAGATSVYFTELGWVDTSIDNRLTRVRLDAASSMAADIPPAALSLTLAGIAVKCNPTVSAPDSRACPP
ncbi:pilus assembly FimT family protein [Massilia endophytica]|uniref:pilus assembly FimT family protein n=1 Tax=Massilia endophytica TaxID=2899220 RepID=UPI001E5EF664|nr:GspH/FimT family pseudopilin [Massilia endophytica]UGQ48913.1 GspH/FimT family pseudopilin [Massilia endophytica]